MAKKKADVAGESTDAAKPAKAAAKKKVAKKAEKAAAPPPQNPQIDTTLAAQAAARMIGAKAAGGASGQAAGGESSAFKQLKESLHKPHLKGVDSVLNSTASSASRKANVPFGGSKQVGRNQTFGADVNRQGVPRRTGG